MWSCVGPELPINNFSSFGWKTCRVIGNSFRAIVRGSDGADAEMISNTSCVSGARTISEYIGTCSSARGSAEYRGHLRASTGMRWSESLRAYEFRSLSYHATCVSNHGEYSLRSLSSS